MILQDGYDWGQFSTDIIGALIATAAAIMIWFLIEYFKKRMESNKIQKGFNKFYKKIKNFDDSNKQKAEIDKAEIIHLIVNEIGIKNISKVLKFQHNYEYGDSMGHVHKIENSLWKLTIQSSIGLNSFSILRYDKNSFHFGRKNQDATILNEFIQYIKNECEKEGIKLKRV